MDFTARLKRDLVGRPQARLVYLGNFEVERTWAQGEPRLPGAGIAFAGATVNRMEEMALLLAGASDVIVLKAPPDEAYTAHLRRAGIEVGRVLVAEESVPTRSVTQDALCSPRLIAALRQLDDGDTYLLPLGVSPDEEELAKATGLPLAGSGAAVCKAVNGKIYSRRLVEATGLRQVPGRICATAGELPEALSAQLRTGGRAVVKESLGVSGRGMTVVDGERAATRLVRMITRKGPDRRVDLVVESWIEKATDLNYQLVVSRSGEVRFETVKAAVLRKGVHQGHRFPVELPESTGRELREAASRIGEALHADGYHGMAGVDAMLTPDGTLYPCLEINARLNMSTYQNRVAETLIPPGWHAVAATFHLRPSRVHPFGEVLTALRELAYDGEPRPAVLVNCFATLNAAAAEGGSHGRIYAICLAPDVAGALAVRTEAERRLERMVAPV